MYRINHCIVRCMALGNIISLGFAQEKTFSMVDNGSCTHYAVIYLSCNNMPKSEPSHPAGLSKKIQL